MAKPCHKVLDALISSRTRIKLLIRFFLNPGTTAYLRGLADEFSESTNAIRVELNRFEGAGMLLSENQGNKKIYKANDKYPLLPDLHRILIKHIGIDRVVEVVIERMGKLDKVYLSGDYAHGKDTGVIDFVFVGDVDKAYLIQLVGKAEKLVSRKLRFVTYDENEWGAVCKEAESKRHLLLWENKVN